jgi:hypothetical protein
MVSFDGTSMLVGFLAGALIGGALGVVLGAGVVRALAALDQRARRRAAARTLEAESTRLREELGPPGPLMFDALIARRTGVPQLHPLVQRTLADDAGTIGQSVVLAFLRLDQVLRRLDADLDAVWGCALHAVTAGHESAGPGTAGHRAVVHRSDDERVTAHIGPGSAGAARGATAASLDAAVRSATERCVAGLRHVHDLLDEIERDTRPLTAPTPPALARARGRAASAGWRLLHHFVAMRPAAPRRGVREPSGPERA